jgi:hypothetical protein
MDDEWLKGMRCGKTIMLKGTAIIVGKMSKGSKATRH